MAKTVLKFILCGLLLLCLVAVPLVGVTFYESPSFLEQGSVYMNRQFGKGSSVYLNFSDDANLEITNEVLSNAATILHERFKAVGYSDVSVTVAENQLLRVDIGQTDFISSLISEIAAIGSWSFIDSNNNSLLDASMVTDAKVVAASGSYYVTLTLTEEGTSEFAASTSLIAASSAQYIYLNLDGRMASYVNVTESITDGTFTFGPFEYASAAQISAFIKNGEMPATLQVNRVETLSPNITSETQRIVYIALAACFALLCVILIMKGKLCGLFASFGLLANVCVFLTALANKSFLYALPTLITMVLCILFSWVFNLYAVSKVGKELKNGKSVSYAIAKQMKKVNFKAIWMHLVLFIIAVIFWMFSTGTMLFVVNTVMIGVCASIINYFIFTYFLSTTLAETEKTDKEPIK